MKYAKDFLSAHLTKGARHMKGASLFSAADQMATPPLSSPSTRLAGTPVQRPLFNLNYTQSYETNKLPVKQVYLNYSVDGQTE